MKVKLGVYLNSLPPLKACEWKISVDDIRNYGEYSINNETRSLFYDKGNETELLPI